MRAFQCVAAAGLFISAPASAQQRHQFDIPPGSLQQAIIAVGRQANVSIALAEPALSRVTVRQVRGEMTVEQALRRLLAGTAASFVSLGDSTYRVIGAPQRRQPIVRRSRPPVPLPSSRQPEPRAEPQEIIITATKRETLLRDYPGPATVLRASDFTPASAAEGTGALLVRVPGLGSTHLGTGRNKLFVRAIADSSFNGPTQSTVGQYLGEVRLNYNAPDPDLRLYDVAAVELLPGPQGTLYGAGSLGGILRIVPNTPDPHAAAATLISSVAATAHGDPSGEIAGMANLPLSAGKAALRIVAYASSDGGYIDDVGIGENEVNRVAIAGGRASLSLSLGDSWQLVSGAAAQSIEGRNSQYADRSEGRLTRRSNVRQPFSNDYLLGYATVRGDILDYRFTGTVAMVEQELSEDFDATQEPGPAELFRQRNRLQMQSAEARVTRTWDGGGGWLIGASLLNNSARLDRSGGPPDALVPFSGVRNSLEEQTLFAEVTQPLSQALSFTGGGRVSHVSFRGRATGATVANPIASNRLSGSEWHFMPSLALRAEVEPGINTFLRYQESFRPGGIIVRTNASQHLDSDHLAATELGIRFGEASGSSVTGALSVSYSRWRDVQADLIDTSGLPTTTTLGDGTIWTLDGRLGWRPLQGLLLSAAGVLSRSRVSNPDPGIIFIEDERLPNVPDVTVTTSIEYFRPIGSHEVHLSARARYVGQSTLGIGPMLGRLQGDYLDTALEARLGSGHWDFFLSITNLPDSGGNRFALGSVTRLAWEDQVTPLRPRTVRTGVQVQF